MKALINFNKSGSGNKTARLIIPVALLELMKLTEDEREVNITYENGKLIIEKSEKE
jgi:antitoxin component of MazEF toxin-antitoxin module